MEAKIIINARLRPRQDKDIIQAVKGMERGALSDYIRDGLRSVLFGKRLATIPSVKIEKVHVNVDQELDDLLGKF